MDVEPIDVDESDVESAIKEAETIVRSIIDGRFTPKLGKSCEKCDQGPICRWRNRILQCRLPEMEYHTQILAPLILTSRRRAHNCGV